MAKIRIFVYLLSLFIPHCQSQNRPTVFDVVIFPTDPRILANPNSTPRKEMSCSFTKRTDGHLTCECEQFQVAANKVSSSISLKVLQQHNS